MKSVFRTAVAGGILLLFVFSRSGFSCRGLGRWKFMPLQEARKEFAKIEAEIELQKEIYASLASKELEEWKRFYANPIFQAGPAGSWEEKAADCHTIHIHDGKFLMFYSGTPYGLNCQIGLATSTDGIHWTRCAQNPVLKLGPPGSWDEGIIICNSTFFDEEERIFKMWYLAGSNNGGFGIGYATSPNAIRWTKYGGNPIIGPTEEWEGTAMEGQTVLKRNGQYMMWYGGWDRQTDKAEIGLATSSDGIHWTKHPKNPVFKAAKPTHWDGYSVDNPDVFYYEGLYHLYYKGWKRKNGISWIGHATSLDGVQWKRDPENPVLMTSSIPGTFDYYQVYRPRVIMDEKENHRHTLRHKMWFSGRPRTRHAAIGYAFQIEPGPRDHEDIRRRFPSVTQDEMDLALEPISGDKIDVYYFTPWLSNVTLDIFDESGKKTRTLVQEAKLPGFYRLDWDRKDSQGRRVPEGLYFFELRSDQFLITKDIVLPK